jgi:tetratricopeptide (TPR) repeat protein
LVKKACLLFPAILLVSCITIAPPTPNLYIEPLPQSVITGLTLEERIQMEEAWDYVRQGRIDQAEKALLRLGTSSPLYDVGQAYINLLQENLPTAEESFKLALDKYPDLSLAHLGLVQLYQKMGKEDMAFSELREVLKKDPQNAWAKEQYDNLKGEKTKQAINDAKGALSQGDAEKTKEAYLKALHFSPESKEIHLALAEIYKKENKLSSALVHLKAASISDPSDRAILEDYAETLAENKQYERSLEAYEKLLGLDKNNKKALEQIEDLKNMLGIYELPSRYNEIPLQPVLTREDIAALLAVKLKDVFPEPAPQPPIIVDISASWALKFILKVTSLSLMEVYSNHSFEPKKNVTRADLAETIFRAITYLQQKGHRFIPQIAPGRLQIPDVSLDNLYYRPISQVLSYQIMELYPDKTFRPDQAVSGVQAIKTIDVLLALVR